MLITFAMGVQASLSAGTGIIRGKVVDKDSKDALPGAVVQVQGTGVGMATDLPDKCPQVPTRTA